ncbi:MAG: NAD(P)/FAD-dependent oxidoreductase [Rubrobacteraceae bacterium]|nr:NAD(P)/FAD-dependent oxidoreductase [Rubrobacteraceae bacterium]MBA3616983.1 NAD(P)/FAD-dependent oxidoreductase [Rubrobacteraceae bacterium]MDQ3252202.1 NAD(P)/FAD-dependent oxidoreductase [Actinomycetota bacterium]MDQ3437140.1 NAD(P)/FAD-dependent oxidoreductase [Actinomycetota bacterium]
MRGKLAIGGLILGAAWGAYRRLSRPTSLEGNYADAATKILIVGGGFGGLAAARGLARTLGGTDDVGVALVDHMNYTTFWPMVPSIIPSNAEVRHVAHSLRRILKPLGIEFFQDEVAGVDFETRRVKAGERDYPYDYLVLAPGSRTTFFGTPGADANTMDIKGLRDALRVRNHVIDRFEEAEHLDGRAPDDLLTFVFVGGGPTGVEAAADTHDLIFDVLEEDYPNVDFGSVRVVLVNAGDNILKGLDAPLVHAATRRLASQRIEVINDARVEEVRPDAVVISEGRTIPTRTTIWAAGTAPPPLVGNLDLQKDHRGRILIDECLRVKGRSGVYAVGDCTSLQYDGPPVPALAQAAEQEGKRAASNLAAEIKNEAPVAFRYRSVGQLVDLGEGSALVDILGVNLSGLLGAYVWKAVYLYELGYDLNRAHVLADWTIDLFTRPDTSKLFEDSKQPNTPNTP